MGYAARLLKAQSAQSTASTRLVGTECWVCASKSSLGNHHIHPQRYGGKRGKNGDNLICLCRRCHDIIETPVSAVRVKDVEFIESHPHLQTLLLLRCAADTQYLLSEIQRAMSRAVRVVQGAQRETEAAAMVRRAHAIWK